MYLTDTEYIESDTSGNNSENDELNKLKTMKEQQKNLEKHYYDEDMHSFNMFSVEEEIEEKGGCESEIVRNLLVESLIGQEMDSNFGDDENDGNDKLEENKINQYFKIGETKINSDSENQINYYPKTLPSI